MPREFPRKLRLNVQLQRELIALIQEELTDPRVQGITVTSADVAADLRHAKIFVSVLGSDEQLKVAVKGLNHAAGKLRHGLGKRMGLRYTPELHFAADVALREGDRISSLINQAVKQDRSNLNDPSAEKTDD